jgi:hydroxyacylglutathione hydrolase
MLLKSVMVLIKIFVCGPLQNNTIVISCPETKSAAVIDPAFDSYDKIEKYVDENDLKIDVVLLTHSHWDHIGNLSKIKEKYGCKIYVHKSDNKNLEEPGKDGIPTLGKINPIKADVFVEDEQRINIGKVEIDVLHTPGHSEGSVCYYLPKEKLLFSGDTLFKGSCGNVSFLNSDPEKMWRSLNRLSKLPKDVKVIPGHGDETTIGKESWIVDPESFFS